MLWHLGQVNWKIGDSTLIVAGVVVALLCVVGLFVIGQFLSLYIQARLSDTPITVGQFIGMRWRKANVRTLVYGCIRARKAGLDLGASPLALLEQHARAGGSVSHVVSALITFKGAGIPVTWDKVSRADLDGRDVLDIAQAIARARSAGSVLTWEQAAAAAGKRPTHAQDYSEYTRGPRNGDSPT